MNPRLDRYGDPIEDDEASRDSVNSSTPDVLFSSGRPRTRDEIHRDRCAQLRAIIRAAKARREAQE